MKKALIFVIVCIAMVGLVTCQEIIFENPGTKYINITIPYSQLNDIDFSITGLSYSGQYPINASLDILNDGSIEWEYKVFSSNQIKNINEIDYISTSSYGDYERLWAYDMDWDILSTGYFQDLPILSSGTGEYFQKKETLNNADLGFVFYSTNLDSQIMGVAANNNYYHAFIPQLSSNINGVGLYLAQGGSSYYCQSSHGSSQENWCDLTIAQAMVPEHLAWEANKSEFDYTENFKGEGIKNRINSKLANCGNPCNITVKINSESPGILNLSFTAESGEEQAPLISVSEDTSNYHISIGPGALETGYYFGTKPNVYVIPVMLESDSKILNSNQTRRFVILNNTLKQKWDELTNNSHPMNFNFITKPLAVSNFNEVNQRISALSLEYPAIVVILDIKDHYPNDDPVNEKGVNGNMISKISFNGFSESARTNLYRYDEEIMADILLHELLHTFINYPAPDSQKLFYGRHPSSFTNNVQIESYPTSDSPSGNEGYYEPYSIMNQFRPYFTEQAIGAKPELSNLDKMLLGIKSPNSGGNYSFYEGNITFANQRYSATALNKVYFTEAKSLYYSSDDYSYWDVRTNSNEVSKGTSTSFDISKIEQNGSALWVYANDPIYEDNFIVLGLNAISTQIQVKDQTPPNLTLIGDSDITIQGKDGYVDAGATAYDDFDGNLTLSITTVNQVNIYQAGTYQVNYSVSDSSGNTAYETRTVRVISECRTTADANNDGIIDIGEIVVHVGKWNKGEIDISEIVAAIGYWNKGTGC